MGDPLWQLLSSYHITAIEHTSSLTGLCVVILLCLAAPKFFLPKYDFVVFFEITKNSVKL